MVVVGIVFKKLFRMLDLNEDCEHNKWTKAKNPQSTRVPDSNTSRATTISEPQSHHQRSSSYHHCLKFLSKYSCLDE